MRISYRKWRENLSSDTAIAIRAHFLAIFLARHLAIAVGFAREWLVKEQIWRASRLTSPVYNFAPKKPSIAQQSECLTSPQFSTRIGYLPSFHFISFASPLPLTTSACFHCVSYGTTWVQFLQLKKSVVLAWLAFKMTSSQTFLPVA